MTLVKEHELEDSYGLSSWRGYGLSSWRLSTLIRGGVHLQNPTTQHIEYPGRVRTMGAMHPQKDPETLEKIQVTCGLLGKGIGTTGMGLKLYWD